MDDNSPEINQNYIEKELDKNKKDNSPDFFKDLEIFQSNENYHETNEILEHCWIRRRIIKYDNQVIVKPKCKTKSAGASFAARNIGDPDGVFIL